MCFFELCKNDWVGFSLLQNKANQISYTAKEMRVICKAFLALGYSYCNDKILFASVCFEQNSVCF